MEVTRRQAIAVGAGAISAFAFVGTLPAAVASEKVDAAIKEFVGDKTPGEGKISVRAPEIAENGNTVPIAFDVESDMTADNYVAAVMLLADGNPNPGVATFHFTPMSGTASASTRIRLAKTQNIVAIAKMSDGSVFMDKKTVKVTIGGCGG